MTEAKASQTEGHGVIRTDAPVLGITKWSSFQGLESGLDMVGRNMAKWSEPLFSSDVDAAEPNPDKTYTGTRWTMSNINYNIRDMIGHDVLIASSDGKKIYDVIKRSLENDITISVSFSNITPISYAFLNSAIGQIYNGEFSEEQIREKLIIQGLSPEYEFLLHRVVLRAKEYHSNPEKFETFLGENYAY